MVTRKDQLARRAEGKAKGKGKGKGRDGGQSGEKENDVDKPTRGKATSSAKPKAKAKAKSSAKAKAKSSAKAKAKSSEKAMAEPEEMAEGEEEDPPSKKRQPSASSGGKSKKPKVPEPEPAEPPKAAASAEEASASVINYNRLKKIMDFVAEIDLEGEETVKDQLKHVLSFVERTHTKMNIYWSRCACGVRYEKLDKDVGYFCFLKTRVDVTRDVKLIVAVATAQLFVAWIYFNCFFSCFLFSEFGSLNAFGRAKGFLLGKEDA